MRIRDNKGSITVFVLVGLLFMTGFLIISFGSNINRSKNAKEQLNILSSIYSQGDTDLEAYERAYTAIRKKNAQLLTQTIENSSSLELTKTFTNTLSDYKIYGNSVQKGTPSPSNPVEIQSVGDKTVNIFYPTELLNSQYIEVIDEKEMEFKWIKTSGIPETYLDAKENTQYAVSFYAKTPKSQTVIVVIYYTDGTSQSISSQILTDTDAYTYVTGVTTAGKTVDYIKFGGSGGLSVGAMIKNLQMQEGTSVTDYEPYGKYKIPVKVSGKNLLKLPISTTTHRGVTCNIADNNVVSFEGTSEGYPLFNYDVLNIPANTPVTLSFKSTDDTKVTFRLRNSVSGEYINITNTSSKTLTFDVDRFQISLHQNYDYTNFEITDIQLEFGTTATAYERYVEPVTTNIYLDEPLRKLGDYKDYIDFSTGTVERVIKKLEFDGTQRVGISSASANRFLLYVSEPYTTVTPKPRAMCDRLIYNGKREVGTIDLSYTATNPTGTQVVLGMEFETLEAFEQYIVDQYNQGTPMYMLYALYETKTETIDLSELPTFEDYTKIEILTEIAPSKIEVTYYGYTME